MLLVTHLRQSVDLRILPEDFHDLEEWANFFSMRLLININDVVKCQNASADSHNFVDALRELYLNRHEKDWRTIVEIELGWRQDKAFL